MSSDRCPGIAHQTRCDVKGCPNEGTVAVREAAMPWIGTKVCSDHAGTRPFTGDFYERGEKIPRV